LVNDVLAYSAIDIPKKFEQVDLNKVLHDIINDFEILIEEKKAVISKNNLPVIDMIPIQARQLLQNLVANAIKFSREGVSPLITVNADLLAEKNWNAKHVDVSKAKYCILTVKDNGIGFQDEYKDQIFSIFQRLHSSDAFEGTGIGLAIAKKITDTHKGFIMAKSEAGKGSTFSVLLPIQQIDSTDNQTNA
jgi:signal transduction histidine kinase